MAVGKTSGVKIEALMVGGFGVRGANDTNISLMLIEILLAYRACNVLFYLSLLCSWGLYGQLIHFEQSATSYVDMGLFENYNKHHYLHATNLSPNFSDVFCIES